MPRAHTIQVYQFDELSDKAKQRARDWWRNCDREDPSWAEYTIEDAVRMGEILGFSFKTHAVKLYGGGTQQDPSIWWQLGYVQSDGVWIEATYSYAKQAHKKIREEAPEDTMLHDLADRLYGLQLAYGYQLTADITDSDRRREITVDHPTRALPSAVQHDMYEIVRDFEQWIYRQLRTEDEYRSADEQVDEAIRANEYEFTEEGEIV